VVHEAIGRLREAHIKFTRGARRILEIKRNAIRGNISSDPPRGQKNIKTSKKKKRRRDLRERERERGRASANQWCFTPVPPPSDNKRATVNCIQSGPIFKCNK